MWIFTRHCTASSPPRDIRSGRESDASRLPTIEGCRVPGRTAPAAAVLCHSDEHTCQETDVAGLAPAPGIPSLVPAHHCAMGHLRSASRAISSREVTSRLRDREPENAPVTSKISRKKPARAPRTRARAEVGLGPKEDRRAQADGRRAALRFHLLDLRLKDQAIRLDLQDCGPVPLPPRAETHATCGS